MIAISDFKPDAVVIAAGLFPTDVHCLDLLNGCGRVVCCDGAANRYIGKGAIPWKIVGDCDSLSDELKAAFSDRIVCIPDQETNDQTKSVMFLKSNGCRKIAILGATGMREDHTLGNISLLRDYLEEGLDVRIFTDYGCFVAIECDTEFSCEAGAQVSIINFSANRLKGEGLVYPLRCFSRWWEGTLNESAGNTFKIKTDGTVLVFVTYGKMSKHPDEQKT